MQEEVIGDNNVAMKLYDDRCTRLSEAHTSIDNQIEFAKLETTIDIEAGVVPSVTHEEIDVF